MDTLELRPRAAGRARDAGVAMTEADSERFLADLAVKGRAPETVERYRRSLEHLAEVLPEDRKIRRGTLEQCREALLAAGYAPRTVNLVLSVANTYVAYMGHREYQLGDALETEAKLHPELTRSEYRHLLQVAKLLGREKVYLLVKLFASADMPVQELDKVTVEAVTAGQVTVGDGNSRRNIRLPGCVRKELLAFAERQGIYRGPLFLTKDGSPMSRTYVTSAIRNLCAVAKVPVEKGNPRCLRRLYLAGRKAIEDNVALLVEQALERQLDEEQLTVGWDV